MYIFSGSWNPLHKTHIDIANYVESKFNTHVVFEICRKPHDKPPLTEEEIEKRLDQFKQLGRKCIVTDNTTFLQRSKYNYLELTYLNPPPNVFIVGFDTILRCDSSKYYFGSEVEKIRCLKEIAKTSRFLVFNRGESNKELLSKEILEILDFVTDFQPEAVSSTEIRAKELINLENVPLDSCFYINDRLYKLLPRSSDEYMNGILECKVYNGEEFLFMPYGTKVTVTDIKLWPDIN